ncbi:hypothetical protein ACFQT0_06910 [Hymenobacter humi]|uniref:histidine kinase n=1 Tax=Hymenobacter humi TaxID=1411620 RepID=A0ABW2U402_9BACT
MQSEKMASLGELTAGIAHEIQNPLNFVNNFADVSVEMLGELREEKGRAQRDPGLEAEPARRHCPESAEDSPPRAAGGQHREGHARAQPRQHRRAPAHQHQPPGRRVPAPGLPGPARQRQKL